jgi:hypothetical protein
MTFTLEIGTIIAILSPLVVVVVWLIRLEALARNAATKATEAHVEVADLSLKLGGVNAKVDLHKEQSHLDKLEASQKFITQNAVSELKRDLLNEITKMEGRLEAQINRLAAAPWTENRP